MTESGQAENAPPENLQKLLFALLILALLYTIYFASTLLIPMTLAVLLALPLYPVVQFLRKFYIPRVVSGAALLVLLGVPFTLLGMELAEPARRWIDRAPELAVKVNEQLQSITDAFISGTDDAQSQAVEEEATTLDRFLNWFRDDGETAEKAASEAANKEISRQIGLRGLQVLLDIVGEMPVFLVQLLAVVILVLFMLVYGPSIYYTAIEAMPQIKDKAVARTLIADTQRELSRYIVTVSTINLGLGLVTTGVLWLLNFQDPVFWGALVALLNFAPYVGPAIAATAIGLAGLDQYGFAWTSLFPAAVYFGINMVESQLVTPVALGRTVSINPLFTMIWLMLWGWLWGATGVLIAVPLLVCLKLVLSRVQALEPWLKVIEARDTPD